MKSDRRYLVLGLVAGLSGCQALGPVENRFPGQQSTQQETAAEAVAIPAVAVRSQGVNLQEGMPVRTTAIRQSHSLYPVAKAGFAYRAVPLWPALQLASVGPLATVDDPGLLPPPVQVTPVVASQPPSQICATAAIAGSLDAGPRQNWVMRKARSFTQLLWGGLAGEVSDDSAVAGALVDQSVIAGQRFSLPEAAVELVLSGQFSSRGLQLTSALVSDEAQPVVHLLYLEQRDCQRAWPDRLQAEVLWPSTAEPDQELSAFNPGAGGFMVQQTEPYEQEGNSEKARLTHYQRLLMQHAPDPAWQQLGFAEPEQGAQVLESYFSRVGPASIRDDTVLVVHVASPQDRRYRTDALIYRMKIDSNGAVQFRPL